MSDTKLKKAFELATIGDYIESCNGCVELTYYEDFTRPQLVDLAHWLNNWNSNQTFSDSMHTAHYSRYIRPIHLELKRRLYCFMG